MKCHLITALAVFMATLAAAAPSLSSDMQALDNALAQLTRRDGIDSCDECAEHLDMCMTVRRALLPRYNRIWSATD